MTKEVKKYKIAVIGLGYVGLPLAVKFGMNYDTLGFDINKERIDELINGKDSTREVTKNEIKLKHLTILIMYFILLNYFRPFLLKLFTFSISF